VNVELPSRLEKYIKEFEDDVALTMSNVKEKSLMVTSYQSKWIRYYFAEKTLNQKLKDTKIAFSKKFGGKIEFSGQMLLETNKVNESLEKLNIELKTSEMCLDFMEKSMAVLDKMNFQIKNVIDLVKLEH
jgi:hypothetical protein